MEKFSILSLEQKEIWNKYLLQLPTNQQDVYFKPEYYQLYQNLSDGCAQCFVYEKDGDLALYPFLLNPVNSQGISLDKQYFDIQGAYGYNGVATNSYKTPFIEGFFKKFLEYVQDSNIIAEFIRYNPILNNHLFSLNNQFEYNRENVFVDLDITNFEKESYEYSTQKNIKKAQRNLLTCVSLKGDEIKKTHLQDFIDIYYQTMDRNKADKYYYFPLNYFQSIINDLPDKCKLYFVRYLGKLISTELVIHGSQIGYSFLGGTLSEYFTFRPNDLLKDFIIKDLKYNGLKIFCLGGGSDGVFIYKKSFAKNGVTPFYVGKIIHNKVIYDKVIKQWESQYPKKNEQLNNMLLKYHF